jgi:hypothetical protein
MTVIAAWTIQNEPFILGDMLITQWNANGEHGKVSTRNNLGTLFPEWDETKILRTSQKVYKVTSKLALAWAGSHLSARSLLREAYKTFIGTNPNMAAVNNFFKNSTGLESQPCTILGWLIDEAGKHCFKWESQEPSAILTEDRFIIGSGTQDLEAIIDSSSYSGQSSSLHNAIANVTNLLSRELVNGSPLLQSYGGGYQLLFFDQKLQEFKFLDSATFIVLKIFHGADGRLQWSKFSRSLKYHFENEVALMYSIETAETTGTETVDVVAALPILELHNPYVITTRFSLASSFYGIHVDYDDGNIPKSGDISISQDETEHYLRVYCENGRECLDLNAHIPLEIVRQMSS